MTKPDTSTAEKSFAPTDYKAAMMYHSDRCDALSAERDTLTAALTQSRAETAAEIERAAQWHVTSALNAMNALHCGSENSEYRAANRLHDFHSASATAIRALATPDQSAALDVAKDTAWAKGMENAAAIADEFGADVGNIIRSYIPKGGAE